MKKTKMLALATAALMAVSAWPASAEMESSIARGGRLYDKWLNVLETRRPAEPHPLYPEEGKYAEKAGDSWRCKECHGWDYKGKDGAYASGKHYTGIIGIQGMAGKDPAQVIELLTAPEHGYGDKLSKTDLEDLANFVTLGQANMDKYIDRDGKTMKKGNPEKGAAYFNTVCAQCHDKDGRSPDEMDPMASLMGNPWEVMHKILTGQPGEQMPAMGAFVRQIVVDIMAHIPKLPAE